MSMNRTMLMLALVILSLGSFADAYKILIIYPTPSFSHQLPGMALTEALVKKGHEVFVVGPNIVPGLKENYTFVDVSFSYKFFTDNNDDKTVNLQKQMSKWILMNIMRPVSGIAVEQFKSEQFLKFQKHIQAEKIVFDVVIIEAFYIPIGCAMARFLSGSVPLISMTTMSMDWIGEEDLGSIWNLSYMPFIFDSYTDKMSLWQRIENWVSHHYITASYREVQAETAKNFFRETYGPEYAGLVDGCYENVSLGMISSNFLYSYPRLLAPNVVELGAMHVKSEPPKKLPKALQDWLDGAEKGVIYFCTGSNLKSSTLPEVARSNFLKKFKELSPGYRVLWKWEQDGKIPGQLDNILAQKWFPQESILAHPKVKVFITQGGLQSFQEAVHYGVPTIGIPWFADQGANVAKMVDAEIGLKLEPHELLSYEKVQSAIDAVLFDERYSKNMKKLSAISKDFTSQSLDKGVFWVEHVARHGGASHLKPSTADTTYFQFFCLDIISVIVALSFVVLYVIRSVLKCFVSAVWQRSNKKTKKS